MSVKSNIVSTNLAKCFDNRLFKASILPILYFSMIPFEDGYKVDLLKGTQCAERFKEPIVTKDNRPYFYDYFRSPLL